MNFDLQATKDKKIKILGGKSWYKLPLHLPLLDIVSDKQGKQYYHVAIPSREDVKQLIQPIDDRILDAYIPVSEQLVEEIWRCEFSRLVKWIESFHGLIT